MENLWEMIAKARGLELNEEFILINRGLEFKHKITTDGLYAFGHEGWYSSYGVAGFIRGEGVIEKLPFRPQIGDTYYTIFSNTMVTGESWAGSAGDYARLIAGIVFRTKEEAAAYVTTWKEIISKL